MIELGLVRQRAQVAGLNGTDKREECRDGLFCCCAGEGALSRISRVFGLITRWIRSRLAVSCYDLARDLAGTVKGLPKDLADNPKYMEGFGQ